ncbi:hypothetical protein HPB50_028338 [Hyalomma asiaticum]|nr:hypothetical protein HPB50_028338 [Hyalomma asiaticum]
MAHCTNVAESYPRIPRRDVSASHVLHCRACCRRHCCLSLQRQPRLRPLPPGLPATLLRQCRCRTTRMSKWSKWTRRPHASACGQSESSDDEGCSRKVPAIAPPTVDAPPPTNSPTVAVPLPTDAPPVRPVLTMLASSSSNQRRRSNGNKGGPQLFLQHDNTGAGTATPPVSAPTASTTTPVVAITATPPQQITVLYRPAVPGAVFPCTARLCLVAGVRDVRVNTKSIMAAHAVTAEWRERLLAITELAGIPVGARLPVDRTRSSGILQGILGDHPEEELLAGLESEVPGLSARRQGTALILDFAASAPPAPVRLFRMTHQVRA